ncbi:MAG: hypothetical protein U0519_01425 [Candidatus Gracilibacteria bacterium]
MANPSPNSESTRQSAAKKSPASSTQTYLRIAEIRDDTVVLKNGGLRSILRVSSINFNLKSEEEQNSIIYSYQGFINTLEFPVQIVVRSKKLDIDNYLEKLKKIGEKQTNPLLQTQTYEYVEYIAKLVEYADIMEKDFLVVVPVDPLRNQKPTIIQKFFQNMNAKDTYESIKRRHDEFEQLKKTLVQRVSSIKVGLENCGLKVQELTTKELIELFYNIYNPTVARYEKAKEVQDINVQTDEQKIAQDYSGM